ncbi:SDR family NAD(P)-dependent oxidoreductase [Gordonia humi]|uniref:SDR family NAD(P)-dependent oxidoreductase n=1 Tax=Gordonia humi TaxID=686429 RepID=UPI00361FE2B9
MSEQKSLGQLAGRRIVVTGGAQGMGESIVRAFAREGASVVSMDLKEDRGRAVADEIAAETGSRIRFSAVDVSDRAAVFTAVAESADRLGGLDVLVNVAGVQRARPAEELTEADFDFLLGVNLRGTLYTNQAAFTAMKPAGSGHIINFGSDAGMTAIRGLAGYSATKGGGARVDADDRPRVRSARHPRQCGGARHAHTDDGRRPTGRPCRRVLQGPARR